MKRFSAFFVLLLAALSFAAVGAADPGDGDHGKGKDKEHGKPKPKAGEHGKSGNFKFTFTVHVTDNGSCSTPWADDTIKRTYKIRTNKDGTSNVREEDHGTFVTNAGGVVASPGKCETDSEHGQTVRLGVTGKVNGYIEGVVTGGTFNPKATCATTCDRTAFFAAFFPGGKFSCLQGQNPCKYEFNYSAGDQNLIYHHWQDKGTGTTEQFKGDIATA
jgi:hypothetical protein